MARILTTVATVIVIRVAMDIYSTSKFRHRLMTRNS